MNHRDIDLLRELYSKTTQTMWVAEERSEDAQHPTYLHIPGVCSLWVSQNQPLDQKRANFAFIAKVHQLLPTLLDELDTRDEILADVARDAGKIPWDELTITQLRTQVDRLRMGISRAIVQIAQMKAKHYIPHSDLQILANVLAAAATGDFTTTQITEPLEE